MDDNKYYSEILISKRVKQLRMAKGLTQKEFADSLGIVQGYLSGIERGKKIPSYSLLMALCYVHNVSKEWLFGGKNDDLAESQLSDAHFSSHAGKSVPLLKGIEEGFPERISRDNLTGFIQLPDIPDGCFAIIAEGDFMAPTVRDGDLVIFRPGKDVDNRSIVLMSNKWGEVILRRFRKTGGEEYFSPENTAYSPFKADADTRIFGTVIDIWRKIRI
ncbi:MAG TPA: XRE family transcriptional regulator [Geobacteraceae bacterium]|nr:XRE family transcriptional regulator [Geobacteraceae bacterium]